MGMLRSSTKSTKTEPAAGPKVPRWRFSILPSMMSCVWFALVCALKVSVMGMYSFGMSAPSSSLTLTVLPVPVGPLMSTFFLFMSSILASSL